MTDVPSVLLLDDGDLGDVREILDQIGATFRHLRGAAIPEHVEPPSELLVTNARHAALAGEWPRRPRPVRIGVVTEDSNTLRATLRRMGFDYLVRRPVHAAALRLLLVRALYRGNERRLEARFAVGHPVTVVDGARREAMLVDLSCRGARVILPASPAVGSRVTLDLPAELTGGEPAELPARVLRASRREAAGKGMAVALAFGAIDAAAWKGLRRVIEGHTAGPSPLAERRRDARHAFGKLVGALDERASRVVMGHDISRGGMRIDPHPDLGVGDEIRLAIYGEPGGEPIAVRAKVVRDDGAAGLALRFRDLPAEIRERIESLVASLPSVESLDHGEIESLGAVVSEITPS